MKLQSVNLFRYYISFQLRSFFCRTKIYVHKIVSTGILKNYFLLLIEIYLNSTRLVKSTSCFSEIFSRRRIKRRKLTTQISISLLYVFFSKLKHAFFLLSYQDLPFQNRIDWNFKNLFSSINWNIFKFHATREIHELSFQNFFSSKD